jgi:hypothetical protein
MSMIVCFRIALVVLVVATATCQTATAEESSHTAIWQDRDAGADDIDALNDAGGKRNAENPIPKVDASKDAIRFRRTGQFYSWKDSCYTQDRHQNWYQIDARLC